MLSCFASEDIYKHRHLDYLYDVWELEHLGTGQECLLKRNPKKEMNNLDE